MHVLVLPVGADRYALPITAVREVTARPHITPLPTAPPGVVGVCNLRGEIVPLFDTAATQGLGSAGDAPFAVVVDTPFGPAGLAVTGMPASAVLGEPVGPSESPSALGAYACGEAVVTLLDVNVLFQPAAGPRSTA
jgi:purine-binding chemotaxis protein CheW